MPIAYPSSHDSGWMPLSDLQVDSNNSLDYKFYPKKVANPLLLMGHGHLCPAQKNVTATYYGKSEFLGF